MVSAEYDAAGRKRFEKERRSDESVVRTIEYTYDALGRLQSVGDYRGSVVYSYERGTGRLQREDYPNGSFVAYTYYGADNPSQVGHVWKVEHKRGDGSLLIGYEYTYDLLGRVEQSVERPSGDTTVYSYTPAGRLGSEVRTGQVAYRRVYQYNLDGSRQWVEREDVVNGTHWDVYSYDAVSGRLASVLDVWSGEENNFVWNPEGTLARWSTNQPNSYARVFGYDEEGRLTRIERDYGNGNLQVAYEYGYNSDGVRVWKRDGLARQEYRYVCRIGCGGVPMRVYSRAMESTATWQSREDYLETPTVIGYQNSMGSFGHYVWVAGHWLADWGAGGGWASYQDQFGVAVGDLYFPAAVKPAPEYLGQDEGVSNDPCMEGYIPVYALFLQQKQKPQPKPKPPTTPFRECLEACAKLRNDLENQCRKDHADCVKKCEGDPKCLRKCDLALRGCLQNASGIAAGCASLCSNQHLGEPIKIPVPIIGEIPVPTGPYNDWCRSQPEDPRKKYPGLPTPGGGWPDYDKKKR